jgi:HPt (histidine-containing phosphotransfer) domain-containing protein
MSDGVISPLADAMNRLWDKHLPQMEERVATLQSAAKRMASGTITHDEQQRAIADAHKLAGVLGTFGLKDGTELAREAEGIFDSDLHAAADTAPRLSLIAEQLTAMIANRTRLS